MNLINSKILKNRKVTISVLVVVLLILAIVTIFNIYNSKIPPEEYVDVAEATAQKMMDLSDLLYNYSNSVVAVWTEDNSRLTYQSRISTYRDNEDLVYLFEDDSEFKENINSIEKEKKQVIKTIRSLPDTPIEHEDIGEELKMMYFDFIYLVKLVTNPEDTAYDYANRISKCYKRIEDSYEDLQQLF